MESVIGYVDGHFHDMNLSLQLLSDRFNVTIEHLSREFKRYSGMNFTYYLHRLRIRKARELLENEHIMLKDVYGRAGFSSMRSFERAFKKDTNIMPSAYRKIHAPDDW